MAPSAGHPYHCPMNIGYRLRWLPVALMAAWCAIGTAFWVLRGPSSREALIVGAGASLLLVPVLWWISARVRLPGRPTTGFLSIHAAGAFVFGNLMILSTYWVEATARQASLAETARAARFLGAEFLFWMWLYVLVGVAAYGSRLQRALRLERENALRAEARAAEARLAALRGQLNPHFLFNALQGVSALIPRDSPAAEAALERLGALLRFSLEAGGGSEISIRDELRFTQAYLELEKLGLGDRMAFEINVDADLLDVMVPPFAVQTLTENAVRHGVARHTAPGQIRIHGHRSQGQATLTVENSGPELAPMSAGAGQGLANLRARLDALHGPAAWLDATPRAGGGFVARLVIPAS